MSASLELLAPAGSLETARAVINAGADAIYFGGDHYGARAYAKNFTIEEGAEAIRYAHLHDAKAYLTVNTLLKNREINQNLYTYIRQYYEAGIDAILVQDIGVLDFIHRFFPALELHASTQMTINTADGANWLKQFGVRRIVASRELSIPELKRLHEESGLELEAFVHGALCVCYSGQCLMSSMFGGRSGNRGRCAQPCRLPYTVYREDQSKVALPGPYILSMKDLCGLKDIPAMAEAGVHSFKIEGRMKQTAYAAGIVQVYRRMLDKYLENGTEGYQVTKDDLQQVSALSSRGAFTDIWLHAQNSADMVTYTDPSVSHGTSQQPLPQEPKIPLYGTFTAECGQEASLTLLDAEQHTITVNGPVVEAASSRPATEADVRKHLGKLGNTPYCFADLTIHLSDGCFLPVGMLNALRRDAITKLTDLRTRIDRETPLPYQKSVRPNSQWGNGQGSTICMASVSSQEQLKACLYASQIQILAVDSELAMQLGKDAWHILRENLHQQHRALFLILPLVLRCRGEEFLEDYWNSFEEADGYLASSLDELGYLDRHGIDPSKIMLNHRIYTWSDQAVDAFRRLGYGSNTIPVELNQGEIAHRNPTGSSMIVYGYLPLMVTTNCIRKNCDGCDHRPHRYILKDRTGALMTAWNHCAFCYNTIMNSQPLDLIGEANALAQDGIHILRLDFTTETEQETLEVLSHLKKKLQGEPVKPFARSTRGHYKRGVE